MCKQLCDNLPLKLLLAISVAVVVVDVEVLRKTFAEYAQLKNYLDHETYHECYKPQAEMRIVFQCYSIFAAFVCSLLTATLAFGLSDQWVEAVARGVINICYLAFGPILLTFVNYGFAHFKNLSFVCSPRGITHHINFIDIVLLLGSFVFALCVTFTMAMQKTLDMAQQCFQDESSLVYRLTSHYFSYQIRQRQERERETQRERQNQRREQRRLRQQERDDLLAAYMPVPAARNDPCPATSSGHLTERATNYNFAQMQEQTLAQQTQSPQQNAVRNLIGLNNYFAQANQPEAPVTLRRDPDEDDESVREQLIKDNASVSAASTAINSVQHRNRP